MKARILGIVIAAGFVTGCQTTPAVAHVHKPSVGAVFHAPTVIQAPIIANDSPGRFWTFPTDPADVMQKIDKWLTTATITSVQMPKVNQNLTFNAYMGPAELYFTDQNGAQITVAPAFYIAHGSKGYYPALFPNIVTYRAGGQVQYLRAPELYQWLANDKKWTPEFRMESCTDAEKSAIHDAKASRWGGGFTDQFPAIPGVDKHPIHPGGAAPLKGKQIKPLAGTFETLVDQVGVNRKVTLIEVWNNGKGQHQWTYEVSPKGTILSHSQSGVTPPQDWQ